MPFDESYIGDSGIFTDYIGTVKDAFAEQWEKAGPEDWFAVLVLDTDSADRPEWTERLSLGRGWSSLDGGMTVVNDKGARSFNARYSNYKKWMNAAIPLLIEAGVEDEISSRGPATKLDVWVGTRWQFADHVENYMGKNPETGEYDVPKTSHMNVPVAFLGMEGSNGQKEVVAADISFLPDDMAGQLAAVAKSSPTKDAFLDKALLDVEGADRYVSKLAGARVYETLRQG